MLRLIPATNVLLTRAADRCADERIRFTIKQPHAVKTVTVMNDVFDCVQIHYGMSADPDKGSPPSHRMRSANG